MTNRILIGFLLAQTVFSFRAFAQSEPVEWTNLVKVVPISPGSGLKKDQGCAGCQDAGANSVQVLNSGDGSIEFTAPDRISDFQIGYTNSPVGTGWANIKWAIHVANGRALIVENGTYAGEWTYNSGDRFTIRISDGHATYLRNDASPITPQFLAPTYPLTLDVSFLALNSSLVNALWSGGGGSPTSGAVTWVDPVRVSIVGAMLQKTSGCGGCQDAGAYSEQSIASGEGYFEFTAPDTTTEAMVGMTSGSGVGTTWADIKWAIHLSAGRAVIKENQTYAGEWSYTNGAVFRITISGGQVSYSMNGGAPVTPALLSPVYPLKLDTSMLGLNARISNAMFSNGTGTPPSPTTLKVLTWNLNKGVATNGNDSVADGSIAAVIAQSEADVALLSAVETSSEATTIASQLPTTGGVTWSVYWQHAPGAEGQAIISRYRFVTGSEQFYQHEACVNQTEYQVIVKATLLIGTKQVHVFAVDQQHDPSQIDKSAVRRCQAEQFVAWASQFNGPRIVGGDFNTSWDLGLTTWTDAGYVDGWNSAAQKSGYGRENAQVGNELQDGSRFGRTRRSALDHVLTRSSPPATFTSAQVWDARDPLTTCGNVGQRLSSTACASGCVCEYVDDKGVRPSDHIPLTVIIQIQ